MSGPYHSHPDHYFLTLGYRFSERTIRRHWPAIMRGIVNRELRSSLALSSQQGNCK